MFFRHFTSSLSYKHQIGKIFAWWNVLKFTKLSVKMLFSVCNSATFKRDTLTASRQDFMWRHPVTIYNSDCCTKHYMVRQHRFSVVMWSLLIIWFNLVLFSWNGLCCQNTQHSLLKGFFKGSEPTLKTPWRLIAANYTFLYHYTFTVFLYRGKHTDTFTTPAPSFWWKKWTEAQGGQVELHYSWPHLRQGGWQWSPGGRQGWRSTWGHVQPGCQGS